MNVSVDWHELSIQVMITFAQFLWQGALIDEDKNAVSRAADSALAEVEPKYPFCIVDVGNLQPRPLKDAVDTFNRQSMESPTGRFETPVTEAETLIAVKSLALQSYPPVAVKSVLNEIVKTKQVPATAYFRRFTRYDDGAKMNRVWWVRLVITGGDPPVYSLPVRTKTLSSRSYTQMERQQNADDGTMLINRFSSYFVEAPNVLLPGEFPQEAEQQLIADARAAIAGDAESVERLFNWDGVSKSTRHFATEELRQLNDAKIESIEVRPRKFKSNLVHWSAYQHYVPNLPVVGYLDIEYRSDRSEPARMLSLEIGESGDDMRLINYVARGKAELPRSLPKGLSITGHTEPLPDGTYLITSLTTNPGSLLSAHLANEEVWKRDLNKRK